MGMRVSETLTTLIKGNTSVPEKKQLKKKEKARNRGRERD